MSSIIAALLSGQAFADQDISGNLFGETVIDSGATAIVKSGATADLGSGGIIYNYGTLQVEGTLNGKEGSRIISGVGFEEMEDPTATAAAAASPFDGEKTYMEPGAGGQITGTGTISEAIAQETGNVIPAGALEGTDSGHVFVLVDQGSTGNFKLQGNEETALEVDENFANRTGGSFTGIEHGLDIVRKVKLSGDNSNFVQGDMTIGAEGEKTEVEIAGNKALPQVDITVQNATLTINADNAKLGGDLTIGGPTGTYTHGQYTPNFHYKETVTGGPSKLSVPLGSKLVIKPGNTLTFSGTTWTGQQVDAPYDTPDTMVYDVSVDTKFVDCFKETSPDSGTYSDGIFTYTKSDNTYTRTKQLKFLNEHNSFRYINKVSNLGLWSSQWSDGGYGFNIFDVTNATLNDNFTKIPNAITSGNVNEGTSVYNATLLDGSIWGDSGYNYEGHDQLGLYINENELSRSTYGDTIKTALSEILSGNENWIEVWMIHEAPAM